MNDLTLRLAGLERALALPDPRPSLSAYHNMPYAIFRYDPEREFELRREVTLLATRLRNAGKRVNVISLAECLHEALQSAEALDDWYLRERELGIETVVHTAHEVLAHVTPLVELVAARLPTDPNPLHDVVLITRTGALFPMYRTFALLEQLVGRVHVPAVLFYSGTRDGAAGLRFMGVLAAEHNYRPKIF